MKNSIPANVIPTEFHEAVQLVRFLKNQQLLFTHIPNETRTSSFSQKRKNKMQGVNKGFPDYVIHIPSEKSKSGEPFLVIIELKRIKKGVLSPEQDVRLRALHSVEGVHCALCEGAESAIEFVKRFLK